MNSAIGSKIRGLREMKNISIEDMAQQSGLNAQYLNAIEEEGQVPTIGELIKIVRVLGVRVGTILDDFSNDGPVISRAADWKENPKAYTITNYIVTSETKAKIQLTAGGGCAISLKVATTDDLEKKYKKL